MYLSLILVIIEYRNGNRKYHESLSYRRSCQTTIDQHDTLRYYEKIDLLAPIDCNSGGIRLYDDSDITRIQFIQRAKLMNFTLDEIKVLLKMRKNPEHMREDVRELTQQKQDVIERQLSESTLLRQELQ